MWRRLLDEPGARRSHAIATPRGGGIAIVAAMLLALGFAACWWPQLRALLAGGSAGLLLVASVGWVDDHRPLSPWLRLGVHGIAALLLGAAVWQSGAGIWFACSAALLAVGLVNVWNFMDGIDGIATSQAMLVAVAAACLAPSAGALCLALATVAACAGFLPFNAPRARIFLGDVGSGALGYLLAILFALSGLDDPVRVWLLTLPMAAFLVDAALTLASRMLRGERWWTPHVQHCYQQCVQQGRSHVAVSVGYLVWALLSLGLMLLLMESAITTIMGGIVSWYALSAAIWFHLRARHRRRVASSGKSRND
nr:glycosyltransferase family 4 protein [Luteimonas sp. BDR2-5]